MTTTERSMEQSQPLYPAKSAAYRTTPTTWLRPGKHRLNLESDMQRRDITCSILHQPVSEVQLRAAISDVQKIRLPPSRELSRAVGPVVSNMDKCVQREVKNPGR